MESTIAKKPYGTCNGEVCDGTGRLCEHFPTTCSSCVLDGLEVIEDRAKMNLYYAQCFYCLLSGDETDDVNSDSYGETLLQGHDALRIGYQDGLDGREIPDMKCEIKELETLYKFGYQMGKALCMCKRDLAIAYQHESVKSTNPLDDEDDKDEDKEDDKEDNNGDDKGGGGDDKGDNKDDKSDEDENDENDKGDGDDKEDDGDDKEDEAFETYAMNLWAKDKHDALVKLAKREIRAITVKKIKKSGKGFKGLSKRAFARKLDKQVDIQCDKLCDKVLTDSLFGWWYARSEKTKDCYRKKARDCQDGHVTTDGKWIQPESSSEIQIVVYNNEYSTCEHFPTKCPPDNKRYYDTCFYCLLSGGVSPEPDESNPRDLVLQSNKAVTIGYQDGLNGNEILDMNCCELRELETLYKSGYKMGAALFEKQQEISQMLGGVTHIDLILD